MGKREKSKNHMSFWKDWNCLYVFGFYGFKVSSVFFKKLNSIIIYYNIDNQQL
jgi:hypothetical protein